jgi:hypothetical protein
MEEQLLLIRHYLCEGCSNEFSDEDVQKAKIEEKKQKKEKLKGHS